jgi:4'-phosphopantetheinyl transferase
MDGLPPEDEGDVDIWHDWVDDAREPGDAAILDDEERARSERFRFDRDRRRFIARRAFLRRVLARYAGLDPARLQYRTSANGKPELATPGIGLGFSASHADGLAVVAVAPRGVVGVDVERVRPIPDALELARHLWTDAEYRHLVSITAPLRSAAFLRIWTRKEAYVKLLGNGLSLPLDSFDVLDAGERSLRALDLPVDFVGSVAVDDPAVVVRNAEPMAIAS